MAESAGKARHRTGAVCRNDSGTSAVWARIRSTSFRQRRPVQTSSSGILFRKHL